MNYLEIDKAIVDIMSAKCNECQNILDAVQSENITEKKAVSIELGMYSFCGAAGMLKVGERENWLRKRKQFLDKELYKYPDVNELYKNLTEEEKMRFTAALQAEIFIRDQWLEEQRSSLFAAEASGDTKAFFELKIKIGAVENMFFAWEEWRIENNVYPEICKEVRK